MAEGSEDDCKCGPAPVKMRAKMYVESILSTQFSETLKMRAVGMNGKYPDTGEDEDNTFARFTPNAELMITIQNPNLIGKFKAGCHFYLDFTEIGS